MRETNFVGSCIRKGSSSDQDDEPSPPPKRRKTATTQSKQPKPKTSTTAPIAKPKNTKSKRKPNPKSKPLALLTPPSNPLPPSLPPSRHHPQTYHHPLLLTSPQSRSALLSWFTKVHSSRLMPWRKPFLSPLTTPRPLLAKRAYEVWISEIMLQQTRVATVISYWNRWMEKWPTMEDLASAKEDEVLSLWQGLGYYSRAKRVHEAAQVVVNEMGGLLPAEVGELVEKVPGVGRYTAGAIAAIVFGRAEAMVDGNVVRVLSRQLGVYGDAKGKEVVEGIWEVAGELARVVAGEEEEVSEVPGRWGQALMELGSTVCTPKPNCEDCSITATCRAYHEGLALAKGEEGGNVLGDIEDACGICHSWEEEEEDDEETKRQKTRSTGIQQTVSDYFAKLSRQEEDEDGAEVPDCRQMQIIVNHARKFPLRKPKKKVREEEIVVCAIRRRSDGKYLIHQRPEKGLLANMWELPSHTLPPTTGNSIAARQMESERYVTQLLTKTKAGSGDGKRKREMPTSVGVIRRGGEVANVPWVFSHLRLTMHVHGFVLKDQSVTQGSSDPRSKWASVDEINEVSMGTGMRHCWEHVRGLGYLGLESSSDESESRERSQTTRNRIPK
ncbi:DNA glycosylase [Immersiella caudata]|uniref:Adenine DNA glycosylase n=1 Tax=Immersiella caudata TaxID=314043 RepID=A0AA39U2Y4_9PEZI|nr:DNA glycosylase [Immersiella caudata]